MYNRPLAGICLGTALFVCAANGAPKAPADGPPASDGTLLIVDVEPGTPLAPGTEIEIYGDGFMADASVSIVAYSDPTPVDVVVADADGVIETSIEVPNLPGEHTLVALGNGSDAESRVLTAPITISGVPSGTLPSTGTSVGLLVAIGTAAALAGLALVRSSRGRDRTASVP